MIIITVSYTHLDVYKRQEPGLLSVVLRTVAEYHANILTIHQSIPVNGIASLTLSVDVLPETGDVAAMTQMCIRDRRNGVSSDLQQQWR